MVKRYLVAGLLTFFFCVSILSAQISTPPAVGDGSGGNPYQIATLSNLYWLTQSSSEWGKDFIQTANIYAVPTVNWEGGQGFLPIGSNATKFTGSYDGQGCVIEGLYIDRDGGNEDYRGMFGYIDGATLTRIRIINATVRGEDAVGILFGLDDGNSSITECGTEGLVTAVNNDVGGLGGKTKSGTAVTRCYSTATVTGFSYCGGLIGNHQSAYIYDSYATGNVTGDMASGSGIGGLVGYVLSGHAYRCYSRGTLNGSSNVGGLAGLMISSFPNSDCFWDSTTAGVIISVGGTPKTTTDLRNIITFTDTTTFGLDSAWDFTGNVNHDLANNDYWQKDSLVNDGCPTLGWEAIEVLDTIRVTGTISGHEIWNALNKTYLVTGDVTVGSGDSLTIQPGVTVLFDAGADDQSSGNNTSVGEIRVTGGFFRAVGTASDSIIFTSDEAGPALGDWYGLYFNAGCDAVIDYCDFAYATRTLYPNMLYSGGILTARRSRIAQSQYAVYAASWNNTLLDSLHIIKPTESGLYCSNATDLTFSNCTVDTSADDAVYVQGVGSDSTIVISGNTITGDGNDYGINCNMARPEISGNTITNYRYGFTCQSVSQGNPDYQLVSGNTITGGSYGGSISSYSNPTLRNNNIYGQSSYQIYHYGYKDIDARNNYWGETMTDSMDAGGNPKDMPGIYDYYQNNSYGRVNYSGWLDTLDGTPVVITVSAVIDFVDTLGTERVLYAIGETLHVRLTEDQEDTTKVETLDVWVSSDTETAPETLRLTETGINTGIFTRHMAIDSSGTPSADGMIQAVNGDYLYVGYTDASNEYGEQETVNDAAMYGGTIVSGTLGSSTVWDIDGSPYLVTGDITVSTGDTLTITPGVEVKFRAGDDDVGLGSYSDRCEIRISDGAELVAVAHAGDSIRFTSDASVPAKEDWGHIYFEDGASGELAFCHLSYSTQAVHINRAANNSITVRNCRIDNADQGIYVVDGEATAGISIDSNHIYATHDHALYCTETRKLSFTNNRVENINGNYSLYFTESSSGAGTTLVVNNNSITNGNGYGIYCFNSRPRIEGNYISGYVFCICPRVTLPTHDSTQYIRFNTIETNNTAIYCMQYAKPILQFNNISVTANPALNHTGSRAFDARFNWWGQEMTDSMEAGEANIAGIIDTLDNDTYGRVDFSGWLDKAVENNIVVYSARIDSATEDSAYQYIAKAAHINSSPVITISGVPHWATVAGDTVSGTPDDPVTDTFYTVIATAAGAADTIQVDLDITVYNDPPTIADSAFTVAENSAVGTVLGNLNFDDPELDFLTFTIISGNDDNLFGMAAETLKVVQNNKLDHEYDSSYTMLIEVSDGSLADTAQVQVGVSDVNEAPWIADSAFVVTENSPVGTVIGNVNFDDPDRDNLIFTILTGNPDSLFGMTAETLKVVQNNKLDHEYDSSYTLTIEVGDGEFTDIATVSVGVSDVNEAPWVADTGFVVQENSAVGTPVGNVDFDDPERDVLTFSILTGNPDSLFTMSTETLKVINNSKLDHEYDSSYTLTIEVADGEFADTATVSVGVSDVNESPWIADSVYSVDELSVNGTQLGELLYGDPEGDPVGFAIVGGNTDSIFGLSADTLVVADNSLLDYESETEYSLQISLSDGSLADTAVVTVQIQDINEPPVITSVSADTATEDVMYTYNAAANDPEDNPDFTFLNYPDWLSTSGSHTIKGTPLEGTPDTSFMIIADDGVLYDTLVVNLAVLPVNDAPWIADSNFAVVENSAAGTVVGLVNFDDPEQDLLTFTIIGDNADGTFGMAAETLVIANAQKLDHEYDSSYSLLIEVSDGSLKDTATVQVGVSDVNESPWIADSTFTIDENEPNGTVVGLVNFDDPERDNLNFTIISSDGSPTFTMSAETLLVSNSANLDHEADSGHVLQIRVTDGPLADTAAVTVLVAGVNEAPWIADSGFVVAENSPVGTVIGNLHFDDPDRDLLSFTIISGNDDNLFGMDAETLVVADDSKLDHEYDSSYTLLIRVSDGSLADTASVAVGVSNVNEAPVISTTDPDTLLRANEVYSQAVSGTDPDGDTLHYSLVSMPAGMMIGDLTGSIAWSPDTGDVGTHEVKVQASDKNGGYDTLTFNITVLEAIAATEVIAGTGSYGFDGVGVTAEFLSLTGTGSMTVTVRADSFPPNLPAGNPVKRFFDITADTGITAIQVVLTFSYDQSEFDASDIIGEATLYGARWNGSAWEQFASVVDTLNNTVRCTTTQFSIWSLGGEGGPVPVELASFTGQAAGSAVALAWTTVSEQGNLGFNILRSDASDGLYIAVNDRLIGAAGTAGGSYSFTDAAGAGTWFYVLEQVDVNGVRTLSDPVVVTVAPTGIEDLVTYINRIPEGGQLMDLSGTPVQPDALRMGVYLVKMGDSYLKVIITK